MCTIKSYSKIEIPLFLKIFFIISQLCFGYSFGFTSLFKSKHHTIVNRFTYVVALTWNVFNIAIAIHLYDDPWVWLNSWKYFLSLIVLFNLKYTVYDLYIDINNIYEIRGKDIQCLGVILIAYWIVFDIVIKGIFAALRCASEKNTYCEHFVNLPVYTFWSLGVISLDCLGITQTLMLFCIRCCLKKIRENMNITEVELKEFKKQFSSLSKCYQKNRFLYDAMIILQLGITVPKMLATLWSMMWYLKSNKIFSILTEVWFAIHLFIQICTPAIVAEMVNHEVDLIKQNLKDKLLENLDESKTADIKHALQLLDTKHLNHLVLRFIPVDLRLLLAIFTICSNYFIVIIQFTHLYE